MSGNANNASSNQPIEVIQNMTPGISGVGSGDPIGIECELEAISGGILQVLLKIGGEVYNSLRLVFYPLSNQVLDSVHFSDTPIYVSHHDASQGQNIKLEVRVPTVSRSLKYGILVAGFGGNALLTNAGHKVVTVSPASGAGTVISAPNDTTILNKPSTD